MIDDSWQAGHAMGLGQCLRSVRGTILEGDIQSKDTMSFPTGAESIEGWSSMADLFVSSSCMKLIGNFV